MSEWQPIETAPKDGTLVLGYNAKDTRVDKHALNYYGLETVDHGIYRVSPVEVIVWIDDVRNQWYLVDRETMKKRTVDWSHWARSQGSWYPTHWMPLPEPPANG